MKILKKRLILLMSMLIIPMLLAACKPKVGPDESAKILFDYAFREDQTSLSKLEAPQSVIDEVSRNKKDYIISDLKTTFTSSNLNVSDTQVQDVYNAVIENFKKTSATTEVVSKSGDSAVVKVKVTYFDMGQTLDKAGKAAVEELNNTNITDINELDRKAADTVISYFVEELKNITVSSDTREATFNFVLKENAWLPEDETLFFSDLGEIASGQKYYIK